MFKNIFAALGVLALIGLLVLLFKFEPMLQRFGEFDDQAMQVYSELMEQILETGNAAEATIWKAKVADGLSADDVEDVIRNVANEHNIKNVGELPLYKQVEAMTGKPYRYMKIYMFCNAMTAARMVDYSDAYSAYLPCRVTLLEDKTGKLWLYTLNMDLMIHGGTPLPPALKEEALRVKFIIQDILKRGASGEF
ncbi:MAG: DUF302 domain-containing protein [Gammaproteobacteria bacterium]|nr:DUF302 domain-containing protein [Gammaproteobacteria bacterium]